MEHDSCDSSCMYIPGCTDPKTDSLATNGNWFFGPAQTIPADTLDFWRDLMLSGILMYILMVYNMEVTGLLVCC